MKPQKRKALLVELGITQASIAYDLGINPSVVSRVLAGKATSRRVQEYIACKVNMSYELLW